MYKVAGITTGSLLFLRSMTVIPAVAGQTLEFEQLLRGFGPAVGNAVIELRSGGFAVVGYGENRGAGHLDAWLIRLDPQGDTLWTRRYGGPGNDWGWDVRESEDGGFLVAGSTDGTEGGDKDAWLFRTDEAGELMWERRFGGQGEEEAWALERLEDGGVLLLAQTDSWGAGREDVYLVRTDSLGETVWTRVIGDAGEDRAFALVPTEDGFVAVGSSRLVQDSDFDILLLKVSDTGELLWKRRYGGPNNDIGHGVMTSRDGGVLITGYGNSFGAAGNDVYLIQVGADGTPLWRQTHGGPDDDRAMMSTSKVTGGQLSIGYTHTNARDWDVYVFATGEDGTFLWDWILTRPGQERGVMIARTSDGAYIMTGTFGGENSESSDLFVIKFRLPRPPLRD